MAFAGTAEVDLVNPNEPKADLGIYNDATGSADSDKIASAHLESARTSSFVWSNVRGTVVPFAAGKGSFKQKDTAGGLMLVGARLVEDVSFGVTAYYGVQYLWNDIQLRLDKIDRTDELTATMNDQLDKTKLFGIITGGCLVLNNVLAIWRPIAVAQKRSNAVSFDGTNSVTVTFVPLVSTTSCGIAVVIK